MRENHVHTLSIVQVAQEGNNWCPQRRESSHWEKNEQIPFWLFITGIKYLGSSGEKFQWGQQTRIVFRFAKIQHVNLSTSSLSIQETSRSYRHRLSIAASHTQRARHPIHRCLSTFVRFLWSSLVKQTKKQTQMWMTSTEIVADERVEFESSSSGYEFQSGPRPAEENSPA